MKKRILALLLVVIMVLSLLPAGVVAEEQTAPENHTDAHDCGCCDEAATWIAWDKKTAFPTESGHYYLTENVDLTGWNSVSSAITICLNGHYIKGEPGKSLLTVNDGAVLTISDCTAYYDAEGNYQSGYVSGTQSGNGGCFFISRGGTLNLESGAIKDSQSTSSSKLGGGAVYLQGSNASKKAVFNMTGGEITGCSAAKNGGAVYVTNGDATLFSEFNMSGGRIHNNTAAKAGAIYCVMAKVTISGDALIEDHTISGDMGAIGIYDGVLDMSGGIIRNNRAANGAGVLVQSGGSMTMTGGEISGNMATNGGGGIYISTDSEFTMSGGTITGNNAVAGAGIYHNGSIATHTGGTIEGNTATTTGGGINATGGARVTIDNTTITKNHAQKAGGIYGSTNSEITLSGGVVTDNTADTVGGGIYVNEKNKSLTVEGDPVVAGNTAGSINSNLHLEGTRLITLGTLTEGAQILVSVDGDSRAISTESTTDYSAYFDGDSAQRMVSYHEDGKLYLEISTEHQHCTCTAAAQNCDHTKQIWIPWENATSLPSTSGYYYLATDVELGQALELSGDTDIKLCLNNKTVTVKGPEGKSADRIVGLTENAKFTITDCEAKMVDGQYTSGKLTGASASAVMIRRESENAIFNMYGGMITGNTSAAGGAACVQGTGIFNLYGGEVSGNTVTGQGGAFFVDNGFINVFGGSIRDNTAGVGAGIYAQGTASVTLAGGTITDNSADACGGVYVGSKCQLVEVSGAPVITDNTAAGEDSNLCLIGAQTVNLGAMSDRANVGITADGAPRAFSSACEQDYSNLFEADNKKQTVEYRQDKTLWLDTYTDHSHCLCDANAQGCDHADVEWYPWESTNSLPTSGNYYLMADVTLSTALELSGDTDIKLCLNGHDITIDGPEGKSADRIFGLSGNAQLTITDCTAKTVDGKYTAGKLTGGSLSGVIIRKESTGVVFNMYGGILTENKAAVAGGAVCVQGVSTFNMYGGEISGNEAVEQGGAFYVDGANLNVYGGTITGNKAGANGGAIYAKNKANVTISGGEISGNTAADGGAVAASNTLLTVTGGMLSENTASSGGGIILTSGAQMKLQGGIIEKNTATANGGGIFVSKETEISMTGGQVSDNRAASGAGIYHLSATGSYTGGTICGNVAESSGGAIYLNNTKLTLSGDLQIQKNQAKDGGGIFAGTNSVLNLNGSTICGNEATGFGGGIYVNNKNAGVTIAGAPVVTDNTAAGKISNLHLGGARFFELGEMTEGAKVGITADSDLRAISGAYQQDYAAYFAADNGKQIVYKSDNCLWLELITDHSHCLCAAAAASCDHANAQWYRWEETTKLPNKSGHYYLAADVTLSTALELSGDTDIKLCLNGHNITIDGPEGKSADRIFGLSGNAQLTITDCTAKTVDGKYTAGKLTGGSLSGVIIRRESTGVVFNMYGGILTENKAAVAGGAVCVQGVSTFNMYGGEISGNEAVEQGGAFYVDGANLNVYGGTICNNKAGTNGGGIYAKNSAKVTIAGGSVAGNTGADGGGAAMAAKAQLTVSGGEINGNSASSGGGIILTGGAGLKMTGGSISNNTAKLNGGAAYVSKNTTVVMSGGTVSGNKTSESGAAFYLSYAEITLSGGTISGNTAKKAGAAVYLSKSTATLSGTNITGNKAQNAAGIMVSTSSHLNMSGGTIANGTVEDRGAGVYHNKSTGTYTGGTISGNAAGIEGAGIYATGSTLKLSGVRVKNNQSPNSGGVGLSTKCDVTMTAGEISGNSGENGAGVLIASKSHFKMSGGKISGNKVTNSGGGIYLSKNAFMTITGGEISDNTACGFGGGIYTYSPCTIGGALIANNKVVGNDSQPNPRGGGVFIGSQTNKAHIHDCQFIGNHSYKDGGGLYGQNMNFITLENVKFENNIADNKGGGMYINLGCRSEMRDITLIGNSSTSTGSGMWAADDLSIHNLTATGNTSTGTGGAVYITTANYDGESYVTNLVKISGLVQVYDNVGNAPDFVLSEGAFATIGSEGLAEGSRINVILRAGLLTQTLFGNYDYEGGNLIYTVTPGTRSATDPEKLPGSTEPEQTEPTEQPTTDETTPIGGADGPTAMLVSGGSIVLWAAIAVVLAAAAVIIPIAIKKKKN